MVGQFLCLERRVAPSGRDMITHPRGTHDDIAVAVAGACVLAAGQPDPLDVWRALGRQDGGVPAFGALAGPRFSPMGIPLRGY